MWELPKGIQYVVIGPFTTSDAVSQEYDGNGFNIEPTKRGFVIVSAKNNEENLLNQSSLIFLN